MKKVFWTSIVWIILFGGFALYMKWFNQPLAEKVGAFIAPSFHCPILQCDVPVCEPTECPITSCDACPKEACASSITGETVEPAVCNCPAQIVTDTEVCTKLSEQLDRIEKKVSGTTTEKSTEELYEEFKTWYENKE